MLWTSQGVRLATGFLMLTALRLRAARILRQPRGVASRSRARPASSKSWRVPSGFAWQWRRPQTTRSATRGRPDGDGATEVATLAPLYNSRRDYVKIASLRGRDKIRTKQVLLVCMPAIIAKHEELFRRRHFSTMVSMYTFWMFGGKPCTTLNKRIMPEK